MVEVSPQHKVLPMSAWPLRGGEDRTVIGEIVFDVPRWTLARGRLGGGTKINIHRTQPEIGSAIVLNTSIQVDIRFKHHFGPGTRTGRGRSVGKILHVEIEELRAAEELHCARRGLRTGHVGIGAYRVRGTNLISAGSRSERNQDRGKQ
jgi:hypothetical protein